MRIFEAGPLYEATEEYRDTLMGFDPDSWITNTDNVAYWDGENLALFEKGSDGVYTGHYFYVVRGKAAKKLALETLDIFFKEMGVDVVRGLTPLHNKAARWMSRQLGFKSAGPINTPNGYCELFVMSPNDLRKE